MRPVAGGSSTRFGWGIAYKKPLLRRPSSLPVTAAAEGYTEEMAVRQFQLTPEAEPILDSMAASFGGDASLALSELLIAHESVESFLDDMEGSYSEELIGQRDRSAREFRDGLTVSWEKVKLDNGM